MMEDLRMENREEEFVIDFRKILSALKKWWVVCLFLILTTTAISFLLADKASVGEYVASGKIMVTEKKFVDPDEPQPSFGLDYSDLQLSKEMVNIYSEIIKSELISDEVITNLGLSISNSYYREKVAVGPSSGSKVMEIKFSFNDEQTAIAIVDEIMDVFSHKIVSIIEIESITILNQANIASSPVSSSITKNIILGVFIGVILSSGLIFMVVLLDNKIKTQSMLKEIFDYPVIGEVSSLLDKKDNQQNDKPVTDKYKDLDKLFIINKYQSSAAEGIRNIRASLLLKESDLKNRIISVMSPLQGQGKTVIAINLAVSLSQIEKKILLIDCDLQSPTIHNDLAIEKDCGLVEIINDAKSFDDCVVNYMQNLDVLCSGKEITFASEFVQSKKLKAFIDEVSKKYDYVVIDSPAIDVTSDALIISKYTDGSLLIVAAGENDRDSLALINERLHELQVNIIGVVLNNKKVF